ncbi:TetR/AcrR family transcriptional regulator [Labrys sp. LIt4]|uniref:TetR/AcrR family transcriptional regulator n=1 Tax=Labrys sp. LIt4 TaxID=2821355 RepID=UPI001ADF0ADA|nr:TetR/AcrR family transcriptional regulator [Labrys sp. LIt4]MBP0577839.1 TetR/AcrR family transcriptional regulator [Labrys sp. LIt4]
MVASALHSERLWVNGWSGNGVEQQAQKGSYHHGDLRAALLAAAELVLAERGVEGFTLRECARRAGVSHAAPAHHFGDVAGLLTAVAALGFETLTRFMREARAGIEEPQARLRAIGRGYVAFARQYPERFRLAFNRHRLNGEDPALRAAGQEAFAELETAIRLVTKAGDGPLASDQLHVLLHTWSVVHGYAHLLLAGQLDKPLEGEGDGAVEAALAGVLARLTER